MQSSVCLQYGRPVFNPWIGKISWRRKWQTHSSILAWKIPWTEETGGLQSMGSQIIRHNWATKRVCAHTHTHSFRLGFLLLLLSHFFLIFLQLWFPGTSLVVQWLRLCASKAVGQRLDISLVREPRSHWFMLPGTASKKKRPWFHWRSCHQIVPPHPSSLQLSTDPWGVPSLSLNPPTSGSYSFHLYSCHHFWL